MSIPSGISRQAAIAVGDMLDCCARIRAGQEVLIAAHVEGLHGGDNLVDEQAVSWIQMAVEARGRLSEKAGRPHQGKRRAFSKNNYRRAGKNLRQLEV